MIIELLWIIPIISFGFFLFLVAYLSQSKEDAKARNKLTEEVDRFNRGELLAEPLITRNQAGDQLKTIADKIDRVSDSINEQQKIIETYKDRDTNSHSEIVELRKKLRDLNKEYGLALSDNYALRVEMNRLQKELDALRNGGETPSTLSRPVHPDMKLYEETRILHMDSLRKKKLPDESSSAESA